MQTLIISSTRLRSNFEFKQDDGDFIQFVEIKQWVKQNTHENISASKLTDALERIFENNYVKRYREKKTKRDMNKCLKCVKWVKNNEMNMF